MQLSKAVLTTNGNLQRRASRDTLATATPSTSSVVNLSDSALSKRFGPTDQHSGSGLPPSSTPRVTKPSFMSTSLPPAMVRVASSRNTQLTITVILCIALISVLNTSRRCRQAGALNSLDAHGTEREVVLDHVTDEFIGDERPKAWAQLTNLIMVAGHAIYVGESFRNDYEVISNETNWILESFQHGQVKTFLKHIQHGMSLLANDSSSLLLFSGGQTRDGSGPRSEAQSYWLIANAFSNSHINRSFTEEYARDSFENLLFSVCRFKQLTGRYPRQITVVGFEFKKDRFISLHRHALRYPLHRFHYVGIDPTISIRSRSIRERATAHGPFSSDPYGCHARVLKQKRQLRNPYLRFHPYPQGCPEIKALFSYCGSSIYSGPLPWDPRVLRSSVKSSEDDERGAASQ